MENREDEWKDSWLVGTMFKEKEKWREKGRVRRKKRSGDRAIRNKKINEYSICNVRIWKW